MKKLLILVSAVALSGTMFAQKGTSDNPYTLEGTINPTSVGGLAWQVPSVRARYFFKDNMAGRLTLDYSNATTDDSNSVSSNSIGLGYEYHLAGNDKMSPYFTAGVKFGGGNTKVAGVDNKTSNLGFGIGAGLDYYISENIYVGLEMSLLNYSSDKVGDGDASTDMSLGGGTAIRMGWRF